METSNQHWLWRLIGVYILSNSLACIAYATPALDSNSSLKHNAKNGRDAYHTCALCHTPEGWGTEDGSYPQLSGQHPNVLIKQLIDIKHGNRDVPTMMPFANEVFDKGHLDFADMVIYISNLPMTPKNSIGKGDNLKIGKKLYTQHCESCHGTNAEGNNDNNFPLLQGQHYQYLLRQMQWIKNGIRKNGDATMRLQIQVFTDVEIQAVADYVSRIKPNKDKVAKSSNWKNPDFHDDFVSVPDSKIKGTSNNKTEKQQ
ncbi:MAG: c-type cytochrome [Cocleimonas sp.]